MVIHARNAPVDSTQVRIANNIALLVQEDNTRVQTQDAHIVRPADIKMKTRKLHAIRIVTRERILVVGLRAARVAPPGSTRTTTKILDARM